MGTSSRACRLAVPIGHLPRRPWASWPPGSLVRSRRWLEACHVPGDGAFCVRNEAGDGIVACRHVRDPRSWPNMNVVDVCAGLKYGTGPAPGDVEDARRRAVPHLLVATPGYDAGVIGRPGPEVARSLVGAVERVAAGRGALPAYAYVPASETDLLAGLREAGYRLGVVTARATVTLPGASFDDYLDSLPGRRRSAVRRELRVFEHARAGVSVTPAPAAEGVLADVARLEARVLGGHGLARPDAVLAGINARLAACFGADMLVVVAERAGRPLASATVIVHGTELHVRAAGIDYEQARPLFAHFVAAYYAPIRLAYSMGLRSVWLGISAFRTKARRGAALMPLYAAVPAWSPPSLRRLLDGTDRWLRAALPGA